MNDTLNPCEKLGISKARLDALLLMFAHYYSEPQNHKGIIWSEFEAFVVGYRLHELTVPAKERRRKDDAPT